MVAKKVYFEGGEKEELTQTEKEVLSFLKEGYMTPQKVAIRRQTSTQAVYKILRNIKRKGYNWTEKNMVAKNETTPNQPCNLVRLHGEQFVLNIIFKDLKKYSQQQKKGRRRFIDNNTIELNKNSVEVYSGQSFVGESVQTADSKSMKYWIRFFTRLEWELGLILVKERRANISRVSAHYSETNNELADQCINTHQKVRVVGDDGKIWLLVDNSFNFKELETVHPANAKQDMRDVIKPFFNDLRQNPTLMSDILTALETVSNQMSNLTSIVSANTHTAQINAKSIQNILSLLTPQNDFNESREEKSKEDYIG